MVANEMVNPVEGNGGKDWVGVEVPRWAALTLTMVPKPEQRI